MRPSSESGQWPSREYIAMKGFSLPPRTAGLVFDIDGTLYRHDAYMAAQVDDVIRRLAAARNEPFADVRNRIEEYRTAQTARRDGKRPSLGNTFRDLFGVPISQSVAWREEMIAPEKFLEPDPRLAETLGRLGRRVRIAALTNNPSTIGRRTLAVLGVASCVELLVGLDDTMVSKPQDAPFREAAARLGLAFSEMIFVGDRYEIDIEPAVDLGAGGLLVESMDDVYALESHLEERGVEPFASAAREARNDHAKRKAL